MKTPIFLGGGGRVARLAISRWPGQRPVVVARRHGPGVAMTWNMEHDPPPSCGNAGIVFDFSGITPLSGGRLEANTDLALAALQAAQSWGARHLFVMSSSAVYGNTGFDPATEDRPAAPANAYGQAKVTMEHAIMDVAAHHDTTRVTILRLANVAGAGQPFDAARVSKDDSVTLHRFADGAGPSRSFVGPDSLAFILAHLGRAASDGVALPKVLNVASQSPTAMADVLSALGQPFTWSDAPVDAIQHVHLDVCRLNALVPARPTDGGDAETLVSQVRAAQERLTE